ncbi:2-alkenal reductase (NADP(+)-dependent) isoform X2 [Arachis hypogaea]|uniref:2-alkenal reductase (NADP(+)-dependent) isoform X2 n=1 Tax=Arachis hypogaea TaxID=3818 RepID=UPI000DECC39B
MEVSNKYVVVKHHIQDAPKESDFEIKIGALILSVDSGSNDVIVKNLYISIDPYQINRMKSNDPSQTSISFAAPITPGEAIDGVAIGKVLVASDNGKFQKDDLVMGVFTWAEYSLVKEESIIKKLEPSEFPLTYHLGVLGFNGLSAYAGFFEVCKPQKGENVFVSAACGAVGNLVGQYAKLFGCYVVGCAGSQDKVTLLKDKLGFDDAFNYKEEKDLTSILARINIRGFLAADFMNVFPDFIAKTSAYLQTGRLHVIEDVSSGVESIPSAFVGIFNGNNVGKKIVKVAEE